MSATNPGPSVKQTDNTQLPFVPPGSSVAQIGSLASPSTTQATSTQDAVQSFAIKVATVAALAAYAGPVPASIDLMRYLSSTLEIGVNGGGGRLIPNDGAALPTTMTGGAQTPSANAFYAPGSTAAGFITGDPVYIPKGAYAPSELAAGAAHVYFLLSAGTPDWWHLCATNADVINSTKITLSSAWTSPVTFNSVIYNVAVFTDANGNQYIRDKLDDINARQAGCAADDYGWGFASTDDGASDAYQRWVNYAVFHRPQSGAQKTTLGQKTLDVGRWNYNLGTTTIYFGSQTGSPTNYQRIKFKLNGHIGYAAASFVSGVHSWYPTSIGQLTAAFQFGSDYFIAPEINDLTLQTNWITATAAAQTPSGNAVVITGATAAGLVSGTIVYVSHGTPAGASTLATGDANPYVLIYTGTTDTFQFARIATPSTPLTLSATPWPGVQFTTKDAGVTHGILWTCNTGTAPKFNSVTLSNFDVCMRYQNNGGLNLEFGEFTKMRFLSFKRGFVMDSGTGQSLMTKFRSLNCSPRLEAATCIFEIGGSDGGYGLIVDGINSSALSPSGQFVDAATFYVLKDHGGNSPVNIYGGRVENTTGVYYSDNHRAPVLIESIEFTGMKCTATIPTIYAYGGGSGGDAAGILKLRQVRFSANGGTSSSSNNYPATALNIQALGSMMIDLEQCSTVLNRKIILIDGRADGQSCVRFIDCAETALTIDATGSSFGKSYRHFSAQFGVPTFESNNELSGTHKSGHYAHGIPCNLLTYPDFGLSAGAPTNLSGTNWVIDNGSIGFTGTISGGSDPYSYQGHGDLGNMSAGFKCHQLLTSAQNGVDMTTQGNELFYDGLVMLGGGANDTTGPISIRFEDDLGNKYDEVQLLTWGANPRPIPISLYAKARSSRSATFRVVYENTHATTQQTLRFVKQMVAQDRRAVFAFPPNGSYLAIPSSGNAGYDLILGNLRLDGNAKLAVLPSSYQPNTDATKDPDNRGKICIDSATDRLTHSTGNTLMQTINVVYVPNLASITTGTFNVGDMVIKSTQADGSTPGGFCNTAGTADTISGVTCSTTSGSKNVTFGGTLANIKVNQYINIAGVTGPVKVTSVNPVTGVGTISANASATVTGSAVSNSSPAFTWLPVTTNTLV